MVLRYDLILTVLGVVFLGAAWLPRRLNDSHISLPMVYVGIGLLLPYLFPDLPSVSPLEHGVIAERLTEFVVIVSLASAGLKLDRPLGLRAWGTTWRLLAVTMPVCIMLLCFGGIWIMGLPLAAAVLLGAVMAPTDPVLASDVQVGPPNEDNEHEVPFALTSEAGLNDGLAFPFVNLALVLTASQVPWGGLDRWVIIDVFWKIAAGITVGVVTGRLVAVLVFRACPATAITDGFVALALTLLAYGVGESVHGYGFLSVFFAAIIFRRCERDHEYHRTLHDFSEQIERMLMALLLILLGLAVSQGLFSALTLPAALLGSAFLLLIRPASGALGLIGSRIPGRHKAAIAGYGIRGIGSFYYLAHGLNQCNIAPAHAKTLWAVSAFIVIVSIIVHGTTASFVMRRLTSANESDEDLNK